MKEANWVEALQMTYDYRDGVLIFTDGVKYTVHEAVLLSKGKVHDDDLRVIHHVKKLFGGEIEDCFGRVGFNPVPIDGWRVLPGHDGKMPEKSPVPPVRPVLQKFYGRRKPRSRPYHNPDQGVLDL